MLPFVGDLNPIKDFILPLLVGWLGALTFNYFVTAYRTRTKLLARKRIRKEIGRAMVVVAADMGGGVTAHVLLRLSHMVMLCTAFLFTAGIALQYYGSIISGSTNSITALFPMFAILCGVLMYMIKPVHDEISELTFANMDPMNFIDKLERKISPEYAEEFAAEIERLRMLADHLMLQRKGRVLTELLAGKRMERDMEGGIGQQPPKTEPAEQSTD